MPLIKCSMCERDISSNAISCPHCGEPMRNIAETPKVFTDTDVCNVVLIDGGKNFIRISLELLSIGMETPKQAKDCINNVPSLIKSNVDYLTALKIKTSLEKAGSTVEIASIDKPLSDYLSNENTIKCSNCGSTNTKKISGASKVGSAIAFGIFSVGKLTKTYQCNKCGFRW